MVPVITRSFQAGAREGNFDRTQFEKKVADPIRKLLIQGLGPFVVVTNAEQGNKLAEISDDNGKTPTMKALIDTFPNETACGRLIPFASTRWGKNPGSTSALNEGLALVAASVSKTNWLLVWSLEMEMDVSLVARADAFGKERGLHVVGFLRSKWWDRPQWKVPQNTACLWDIDVLKAVEGFNEVCNGTGETVVAQEFGEVPLAGMEDFHTMLRMIRVNPGFRWGMVGVSSPLIWDTNFPKGSERESNHLKKVARQALVMEAWAKKIFPEASYGETMDSFFSRAQFGV